MCIFILLSICSSHPMKCHVIQSHSILSILFHPIHMKWYPSKPQKRRTWCPHPKQMDICTALSPAFPSGRGPNTVLDRKQEAGTKSVQDSGLLHNDISESSYMLRVEAHQISTASWQGCGRLGRFAGFLANQPILGLC